MIQSYFDGDSQEHHLENRCRDSRNCLEFKGQISLWRQVSSSSSENSSRTPHCSEKAFTCQWVLLSQRGARGHARSRLCSSVRSFNRNSMQRYRIPKWFSWTRQSFWQQLLCLSALSVSVCVSLSLSNILYSYTSKDFSTIITCDTTEVSLFASSSSWDYKTPYLVSVRLSACPQL